MKVQIINPACLEKHIISDVICGVYFLWDNEELVYVGMSKKSIASRIHIHAKDKQFNSYSILPVSNEESCAILERYYIDKYLPIYNIDPLTLKMKEVIKKVEEAHKDIIKND